MPRESNPGTSEGDDRLAEQILLRVLELPPADRQAALRERCGGDETLYERLVGQLEAETVAAPPGYGQAAPMPGPPKRIGQYEIEGVIATGGMGTVYEAMQEHPRRRVALKVMKAGIASPSTLRRFEHESEVLARLLHPGIAQVYEAGTHEEHGGTVPYFVMEYVPGARTLTQYADEQQLDHRARLELLTEVCDAIHHGHQKGIIHRDIKPANILVDPAGQIKVIDFGVARATDADLALTTQQTDVGQLVGTLQYMSPEQCAADPADLDTRSDVYALGVVLYELLCGTLPYDLSRAPVFEAVKIIRFEPPVKPSTFSRRLRGDIETIALKALEKEPDRRYQSAVELAADIRRYMHEEPIEARPPSVAYQIRMFARRNRVVFTAMAVIALTLVAAATVSAIFAINAELSRRDEVAANQVLAQKEETLLKSLDAEREARSAADEATAAARAAEAEQRRQRALTNRSFAQSARERGDWAEVRANVRSAIELGIDDPVPLMLWDVEAIWETTNAPGSITARLDEIEAHPDAAEHAGAIALWRAFAQFDPRITADRMRELIRTARQQPLPAFEAALADALLTETVPDTVAGLRRAHELDRYEPRALSRLLAGVILLDRYTEAEQLCRDWLARDPDNTKAWQYLAAIHARRGELDLAIEIIEGHYPATGDRRDEASKAILIEALQILSLFREAEDILLDPTLRQQLIERVGRYAMQTNSFSIGGPLDITGSIFGLKGKNGAPSYLDGLALSLPTMASLQRPSQERIELAEDRYAVLPNNHAAVGLAWSLDGAGRPVDASQLLRRHIESHEPADRWGALPLAGLVIELQLIVVMRDTDQERVDNLLWFITVLLQDDDANPAMLATAVYASVFTGRTSMLGWGLERLRQTVITDLDLWRRAAAGNAQNVSMRAIGLILATVALEQHPQDAELQAARDEITSGIESGGQPQERRIVAILRDIGLLPLRSSEPAEPDAGVAEPDDA